VRRNRTSFLFLSSALLLLAACASEPAETPAASPSPSVDASANPSGTWTGDWGPSERDRNNVSLELQWNGSMLTGTINPGQNPVPLMNTSYDPATGALTMEAEVPRGARTVHYKIQGQVAGNTMTGTWQHDNAMGDFRVSRT
jgi:hypothetical protein